MVLAAGSWAGQVDYRRPRRCVDVKPVRGQLLHLAWPTAQPLRHVLWGTDCYIVPWLNGRVLVGATVEDAGFDERATAAGVRDLLEAGCALVPHLWQASFAEVRVGLRPAITRWAADRRPVDGRARADLRDRPLSQRRAAGAADRGAREGYRSERVERAAGGSGAVASRAALTSAGITRVTDRPQRLRGTDENAEARKHGDTDTEQIATRHEAHEDICACFVTSCPSWLRLSRCFVLRCLSS